MALADAVRQRIILTLLPAGAAGLRVGCITEKTHLSRPAISHHLKILKDAGLVSIRQAGTMNFYFIDKTTRLRSLCAVSRHIQALEQLWEHSNAPDAQCADSDGISNPSKFPHTKKGNKVAL